MKKYSDQFYLVTFLVFLVILDLFVIGGILWKGHANFIEVYNHL